MTILKKKLSAIYCILLIFTVIFFLSLGFICTKIVILQENIIALNSKYEYLEESLKNNSMDVLQNLYSSEMYNYLAIGNSITIHPICEYWWTECGMAATKAENDYFHLVDRYLTNLYGNSISYAYNFNAWERQSMDRAETLDALDQYLSPNLNLVTIQLGENVILEENTDIDNYKNDYEELIRYIIERAPNAQILIVDDFWIDYQKTTIEREVAENCNVTFVSLNEIKGKDDFLCDLGTIVYDAAGTARTVESGGVTMHPNDAGMCKIADAIINEIYR